MTSAGRVVRRVGAEGTAIGGLTDFAQRGPALLIAALAVGGLSTGRPRRRYRNGRSAGPDLPNRLWINLWKLWIAEYC